MPLLAVTIMVGLQLMAGENTGERDGGSYLRRRLRYEVGRARGEDGAAMV